MVPTDYFGENVLEILGKLRGTSGVIKYSQIEGDEYLNFPENGFYLHSENGTGKVSDCRIYFEARDNYFPAKALSRGKFGDFSTLEHFSTHFGPAIKEVRSVKIPGADPTLPGKVFEIDGQRVAVYTTDANTIAYIHVRSA